MHLRLNSIDIIIRLSGRLDGTDMSYLHLSKKKKSNAFFSPFSRKQLGRQLWAAGTGVCVVHCRLGCLLQLLRALWVSTWRGLDSSDCSLSLSEDAAAKVTGSGSFRTGKAVSSK